MELLRACNCKAIVWGEENMSHKFAFKVLNRILKDIRGNSNIMGQLLLILSRDFRQTLPVIPTETKADEYMSV